MTKKSELQKRCFTSYKYKVSPKVYDIKNSNLKNDLDFHRLPGIVLVCATALILLQTINRNV